MDTKKTISLMLVFLFMSSISIFAQQKLIVKTKNDIKALQIKNLTNGNLSNIPTWNKSGGGFLLAVSNLDENAIVAGTFMEVQLFNLKTKQATNWIQLMEGQEMSLSDCFDLYEKGTVEKGDEMASVSDFFGSTFSGYAVSGTNMVVRGAFNFSFKDANPNYLKPQDLKLEWKAKKEVERIYLKDLTENKLVWMSTNYTANSFDYETLKQNLGDRVNQLLKVGDKYEFQVFLKGEKKPAKHTFKITPAYYNLDTKNSFLSWENIQINWHSLDTATYAWIEDSEGNSVWEAKQFAGKKITYELLKNTMTDFDAGHYKLILEYNKLDVPFEFEIFASPEEVQELKKFVKE